jgi:hypothetical protein
VLRIPRTLSDAFQHRWVVTLHNDLVFVCPRDFIPGCVANSDDSQEHESGALLPFDQEPEDILFDPRRLRHTCARPEPQAQACKDGLSRFAVLRTSAKKNQRGANKKKDLRVLRKSLGSLVERMRL